MFTRDGLFGFDGRIRRSDWWIGGLLTGFVGVLVLGAFRFGTSGPAGPFQSETGVYVRLVVEAVLIAPFAWIQTAIWVKRGHDLSIPAWPLITFQIFAFLSAYVPLALPVATHGIMGMHPIAAAVDITYGAGFIFCVIVLGFIPGKAGTNRYGPSTFAADKPAFAEPGGID